MLDFFEASINTPYRTCPNEYFRELQQAKIDEQWEDTSARYTALEQTCIGSKDYEEVEVWVDYVVSETSTGLKTGDDFLKFIFQDIDHIVPIGLYYKFNDNYYITHFTNDYNSLDKIAGVRRCNNYLRIVDPKNGSVFSAPCVIDYDMASPSVQISKYLITPNNHAVVMVQGNEDTLRLFKLNKRFMLGGRPFKLNSYQNAINENAEILAPTLLYLDLYLDELHDKDDIENQLADNGDYNYELKINTNDLEMIKGSNGQLDVTVLLNGRDDNRDEEVDVVWCTDNFNVIQLDGKGGFVVVGNVGDTAKITAWLEGNEDVSDNITVTVVEENVIQPVVYLQPDFVKLRQYESIEFIVNVDYGGKNYTSFDKLVVSLGPDYENLIAQTDYLSLSVFEGEEESLYRLTALKYIRDPQSLYIHIENSDPEFKIDKEFNINIISMFG